MSGTKMPENSSTPSVFRDWGRRWVSLYVDGFRSMTLGRTLWALILIKLAIIFLVLKIFFFPDFLAGKGSTVADKADYVRSELLGRSNDN